jgi:hypothetical protein
MERVEKILFGFLVTILVGVAAGSAVVVARHVTRCDRFHVGPSWRHGSPGERNRDAERIVDCGSVDGLARAEVRRRLGPPLDRDRHRSRNRPWHYDAGGPVVLGPLVPETLVISFRRDGRVRHAWVRHDSTESSD